MAKTLNKWIKKPKKSKRGGKHYRKYNTAPLYDRQVDGRTFASKLEATRYRQLKLMIKANEIKNLKLQPRFEIHPKFKEYKRPLVYVADFMYDDKRHDKPVVEEVKGYETRVYKIKKRLFLYLYGDKYEYKVLKSQDI